MRNLRTLLLSAAILGATCLTAACSSAPPYVALPIKGHTSISNVEVTEVTLYDIVRVGVPTVQRIKGTNQLEVSVPILSIHHEPIQILVQVFFLDAAQQPIGDQTNRQAVLIAPGETVTHKVISKKAEAQDWLMRISWDF